MKAKFIVDDIHYIQFSTSPFQDDFTCEAPVTLTSPMLQRHEKLLSRPHS